jgi:putative transposase
VSVRERAAGLAPVGCYRVGSGWSVMDATTVVQAYRFALDPTPAQQRALASQVGAARVAFNRMLAEVKATSASRHWERRILGGCVTDSQGWSLYALRRRWNEIKHDEYPWWREVSKEAFNTGLDSLARALTNWSKSRTPEGGRFQGRVPAFPQERQRAAIGALQHRRHPCRTGPASRRVAAPGRRPCS